MISSKIQKATLTVVSVLCVIAVAFGIYNKTTFNTITRDKNAFDNAKLDDYSFTIDADNEYNENIDFSILNNDLECADTVLVCTVKELSNQYECLKYDLTVDKVVKGNSVNAGEEIVFYEYSHFIINDNNELQYFKTANNNFPLIEGKQYLIFANQMQYEEEYAKTLAKKEFRISDAKISTFCIDDAEVKYFSPNVKTFKEVKEFEYICFSENGAENLTQLKQDVLDYYLYNNDNKT